MFALLENTFEVPLNVCGSIQAKKTEIVMNGLGPFQKQGVAIVGIQVPPILEKYQLEVDSKPVGECLYPGTHVENTLPVLWTVEA